MAFNVIGLISGGKDSLYSLAHCVQHGHKIVALANLHPPIKEKGLRNEATDDMDSFMYQTVGHSIVPLYADALQVPLYRKVITGQAQEAGRYYEVSRHGVHLDETEDMFLLVQQILQEHPEANALSAGAILSTYQRTRVESVAVRLNLTPLAYLWQYPSLPPPGNRSDSLTGLLEDMRRAGCDARIIKIASGGIALHLLAKDISQTSTGSSLVTGLAPFFTGHEDWLRGAVLGEGGEYETIALNGPAPLWKHKIDVEFSGSHQGEGGTQYSVFANPSLVSRETTTDHDIAIPALLDSRFAATLEILAVQQDVSGQKPPNVTMTPEGLHSIINRSTRSIQFTNLTCAHASLTPAKQLETIIAQLKLQLEESSTQDGHHFGTSDIVSVTMVVDSMSQFTILNEIYKHQLWPQGRPNPPARVTIAAPLPSGVHVSLSVQISQSASREVHKGLHVQGLSYWAPANIGPYSQAISTPVLTQSRELEDRGPAFTEIEVVHMAGQIPLLPATMTMSLGCFKEQSVLALQHLWRIGQERGVDTWAGAGVAFLSQSVDHQLSLKARANIAYQTWMMAHAIDANGRSISRNDDQEAADDVSNDIVDLWEMQHLNRGVGRPVQTTLGHHLHVLPNIQCFARKPSTTQTSTAIPVTGTVVNMPFIAAVVTDLPRSAPVEWWSTGIAGLSCASNVTQANAAGFQHSIGDDIGVHRLEIYHAGSQSNETDMHTGLPRSCFAVISIGTAVNDWDMAKAIDSCNNVRRLLDLKDGLEVAELVSCQAYVNLQSTGSAHALIKGCDLMCQAAVIYCHELWVAVPSFHIQQQDTDAISNGIQPASAVLVARFDINASI